MSQNRRKKSTKKKKVRIDRVIILVIGIMITALLSFKMIQGITTIVFNLGKDTVVDSVTEKNQFDLSTEINKNLDSEFTILIDAGHGGNDKGAMTRDGKIYEKDLVLEMAKDIAMNLSTEDDMQVIVSRTDDTYLSLSDRSKLANEQEVDLFVSIHLNSQQGSTDASGIETYYTTDSKDGSKELAESVQKSMISYVEARDRGVKESRFQVLLECNMPSILVEAGFLSNPEEAKKIQNKEYQSQLAEGIAQGIISYLDQIKDK